VWVLVQDLKRVLAVQMHRFFPWAYWKTFQFIHAWKSHSKPIHTADLRFVKMNLHHPLPVIVFATGPMHSTNPRLPAATRPGPLRFWLSAGRRLDEVIREAEQDSEARKRGKSFISGDSRWGSG